MCIRLRSKKAKSTKSRQPDATKPLKRHPILAMALQDHLYYNPTDKNADELWRIMNWYTQGDYYKDCFVPWDQLKQLLNYCGLSDLLHFRSVNKHFAIICRQLILDRSGKKEFSDYVKQHKRNELVAVRQCIRCSASFTYSSNSNCCKHTGTEVRIQKYGTWIWQWTCCKQVSYNFFFRRGTSQAPVHCCHTAFFCCQDQN